MTTGYRHYLVHTFVLTIITLNLSTCLALQLCDDLPNVEVNPEKINGLWFENARVPQADLPICVSVNASKTYSNLYSLRVNKTSNSYEKWSNATTTHSIYLKDVKQGMFKLNPLLTDVDYYKVVRIEPSYDLLVICGSATKSNRRMLLKALTRNETLSEGHRKHIERVFADYGASGAPTWVQQYHCSRSSAPKLMSSFALLLMASIFAWKVFVMK